MHICWFLLRTNGSENATCLYQGEFEKSLLQAQKSTFPANYSPSPSLAANLFALNSNLLLGLSYSLSFSAYWPCLDFQHHQCTACWEVITIFDSVRSFPHIFHIYIKSTATLTYHQNFAHVVSSVVTTSKICSGRSRNSSRVESQGYFVSWRPFFQFNGQQAKVINKVQHLTCFLQA